MPAKARVRWLAAALRNLSAVGEHIAQDDPQAAAAVVNRIWEAARGLAAHPGMGRPGRVPGTRELILSHLPYVVAYAEMEGEVRILRVLHSAQRWPRTIP
jgi:addiction module RelE/StbE family toxin